ncbi:MULTISPECIES: WecB/TagA/CpsF family glycosyltransferase [Shewanella]|uniref:WecB/TagA/CpsF family glycosyltransferase n=1 Tax=Shewanella TaxID=22 RepID=UPI000C31F460|nr:WecB/TagA/CpsF family glycosyltransferase [Shewanella algae]MBO2640747.1 WecB/TagA/CpsF family glycosyltransferase [Shewanella algae]
MNDVETVTIGGICISSFNSFDDIIEGMVSKYRATGFATVIAVNPEKIVAARDSLVIKNILLDSDIKYPDGVGVSKVMSWRLGRPVVRLPGCELWERLMKYSGDNNLRVFLVGGSDEVLNETVNKLKANYTINLCGSSNGYFKSEESLIQKIKSSCPSVVTVAMGSPRQEEFIFKCKKAGINAIYMGVGGSYDVYTGRVKRAPAFFRKFGLEWLYRLCSQPTRFKRQISLVRYFFLVILKKI